MDRRLIPLSCLAVSLALASCGNEPAGPGNPPTPSALEVAFTGETARSSSLDPEVRTAGRGRDQGLGARIDPIDVCEVTASWTQCPDDDFLSYVLFRSESPDIEQHYEDADVVCVYTDATEDEYVDWEVDWSTQYYYILRTADNSGQQNYSWSNEVGITTPEGGAPTPSVLSAYPGASSVQLYWTECYDDDFEHYALFRSYDPGIESDTLSADNLGTFFGYWETSFTDSTLVEQTAYYALRTRSYGGLESWSNEVEATLLDSTWIVAWGRNDYYQCDVPYPNESFTSAAGGWLHSLGLRSDGSITVWGDDYYGISWIPEPNSGYTAVYSGIDHALALRSDGSLVAWGRYWEGQCDVPDSAPWVWADGGAHHSLGVLTDGSVVCWGSDSLGQCQVPSPNQDFVAVSAGIHTSLGLKIDGSIVGWGDNTYGQCEVPPPNTGFCAVASGAHHSLGLKQDGTIAAWGANWFGQCDVPAPNQDFVAVAAGLDFSMGLKSDGTVVVWGENDYGQCDVPYPNEGFISIAAGCYHCLAVRSAAR